ncbi:MAG: Do family serine endopeptidase, partial [Alphaproteobacteria bacterium]|nr:Do family serine endopeptidase [Alphaproteobacteria bacterium]
ITKRVAPAVVNIYTARVVQQRVNPLYELFFGQGRMSPRPRVENSLGSGVIVDASGLVITNNHVIEGATEILVALADRREYPAKLVFADPRVDLAVLRIDPKGAQLPVVPLGDSDRAEVGDVVIAIGNPFGVGQTVTHGIVSAVARTGVGVSDYQFFLQTDAAINPGNSGGALVAMDGSLVGINTAIFSRSGGSNGIGFAIPSNMVRMFLGAAQTGKFVTAWIGAEGEPVTAETAPRVGLDRPTGVLLTGISAGSPAAQAGLRAGDVVYAIDGKEVADAGMMRYRIATQPVGATVTVTVIRDGKPRNIALRLAAPPETPSRDITRIGSGLLAGVTVGNLSPAFAQELGAGLPERGVVVVQLDARAPLAQLRALQPGDILEAVNGVAVATAADLQRLAPQANSIRLNRGGRRAECGIAQGQLFCRS